MFCIYRPKKDFSEDVIWDPEERAYIPSLRSKDSTWLYFSNGFPIIVFIDPINNQNILVHASKFIVKYPADILESKFERDFETEIILYGREKYGESD